MDGFSYFKNHTNHKNISLQKLKHISTVSNQDT